SPGPPAPPGARGPGGAGAPGAGRSPPAPAPGAARPPHALTTAADGLAATPLQVALAWVRDRPGVCAPLVGPRTAEQLAAALSAEALTLPDEICQALDDVSAPVHRYPDQDWSTL
ncbi:aldo/keto reductase, partial [Streptomyces albidoflavus]